MVELVGVLHRAGVPIVAGTDGWGIELVRELELYRRPVSRPPRRCRAHYRSRPRSRRRRSHRIDRVGKEADMVLVDGDPSKELGALRRVVTVVSDGYVMDADALRSAAGYTGRPK
jgi:hypothetical protein